MTPEELAVHITNLEKQLDAEIDRRRELDRALSDLKATVNLWQHRIDSHGESLKDVRRTMLALMALSATTLVGIAGFIWRITSIMP